MTRSVLLSRRDWVAHPDTTFSGGNWITPFSYLVDPRPQVVLRAISPDPPNTTFTVDFGIVRTVAFLHFQGLNVTSLATIRIRAGVDSSFITNVLDTDFISAWPQDKTPLSITPWGELTVNGVYETEEYVAFGMPRFIVPAEPITIRYIKVEIVDQTAAVAAQIGTFGACEAWEPQYSDFGWQITFVDETEVDTAPYGSRFFIPRGLRRRINMGFSFKEPQVKSTVMGWAAMMGKRSPIVIIPYPDDTPSLEKRAIYGTITEDVALVNPYYAFYQMPLTVEQLI